MHCIVFVIKATTNMQDPDDETLKKIKAIQQRINGARMYFLSICSKYL